MRAANEFNEEPNAEYIGDWINTKLHQHDYNSVDIFIKKVSEHIDSYNLDTLCEILDITRILPTRLPSRSSLVQSIPKFRSSYEGKLH